MSIVLAAAAILPGACKERRAQPGGEAQRAAPRVSYHLAPAFARANAEEPGKGKQVNLADIAERSLPGVVNIASTRVIARPRIPLPFDDPFFRRFFGEPGQGGRGERAPDLRERSLGSGVLISRDGLVLTNSHVVEGTSDIRVTLSDRREVKAKVVGTDPKSDVAVLRLEAKVSDLKIIPFGNSDQIRLGDVVLAIGDPFGVGQTVTMGIISAKGRANMGIVDYEDFIQTDAAINPGNSGGALVNMRGELIGIPTAILSRTGGYQGIGFAIPSNMVRPIVDSLLKYGKVVRGWLGLAIQDLNPDLAQAMGLKEREGVLVSDVTAGSPAARAGVQRGDLVLAVNGARVETSAQLRLLVASQRPGTQVRLELSRRGRRVSMTATLGQMPASAAGGPQQEERQGLLGGLRVRALDPSLREKLGVPPGIKGGVVVEGLEAGSAAASSGLRPGDVIVELNQHAVASVPEFTRLYKQAGDKIALLVLRDGNTLYLVLSKR